MSKDVDQLLRDAGRSWQQAQSPPPVPRLSGRLRRSRTTVRWSPVLAGGITAAVLVSAGVALLPNALRGGDGVSESVVVVATAGVRPADLVVNDGDRVSASGTVVAVPGQPVRFCAPAPVPAVAGPSDTGLPDCTFSVRARGVNLDRLSESGRQGDVRFGTASLTGIWRGGVLEVTGQGTPVPERLKSRNSPCPPPEGGWKSQGSADSKELHRYVVDEHPERFRRPWVAYPKAATLGASTADSAVEVLVVEVVDGRLDAARADLRSRYDGNLCVVDQAGAPSLAKQRQTFSRVQPALTDLMRDPANGIYTIGQGDDDVSVDLVVLTPTLADSLAGIGGDALVLRPWLAPVD